MGVVCAVFRASADSAGDSPRHGKGARARQRTSHAHRTSVRASAVLLSLIHISEPTRLALI
eukprot:15456128-Alexandrium_andersonii.AAC.1